MPDLPYPGNGPESGVGRIEGQSVGPDAERLLNETGGVGPLYDPDFPIVWPHEYVRDRPDIEPHSPLFLAWKVGKQLLRQRRGTSRTSEEQLAVQQGAALKLNGEGAELLVDKYPFIELVRRLGYLAPKQLILYANEPDEQRLLRAGNHFPELDDRVIAKPYCDSNGRGIAEMLMLDLPGFTSTIARDYILQEYIGIAAEIRYIRQVDYRGEVIQRVHYTKEIPKLYGDGMRTKQEIIEASELPESSRQIMRARNQDSLGLVMPDGYALHVPPTDEYPPKTTIEWDESNRRRIENMDRFMTEFIASLQGAIGHPMPVLCFDIGIKDMDVLSGPYDFEAMKQVIVPFETQIPFTLFRYISESSKNWRERWAMTKILWSRMATGSYETMQPTST